jgi:tetratricopeptide (TPR) repeat protein
METDRITLAPLASPGEVTTFYSFESSTARSVALAHMAVLLADRDNATLPVLMIDWDTESPGLHHHVGLHNERPGLLEYFEACREHLNRLGSEAFAADHETLARRVLAAVDWGPYVERVDQGRSLYLMRAGRFDDSYGERASRMDWAGLFGTCPPLFRCFGEQMARHFRHVLVDSRSGRSAAVSICTALLPRKLVSLFSPTERSLDGLAGVVGRAIECRCADEDGQRPLLVYPLAFAVDSSDCRHRRQWRHGGAHGGGYQGTLEALLRDCYRIPQLSLDSYFDEVQLQQSYTVASGGAPGSLRGSDRFSLDRSFETLLDWMDGCYFPWQSQREIRLLDAVAGWRAQAGDAVSSAASVPLAHELARLGELYRGQGQPGQARQCFDESIRLRQRLLGDDHPDTRASRAGLAALLRETGKLEEAKFLFELLLDDCLRLLGDEHADTLAARAGLAATLSRLTEFDAALVLHEQAVGTCERLLGPVHRMTLDRLAAQADTLAHMGEPGQARQLVERVLEGRRRLLGAEHEDTLQCSEQLAVVLRQLGDPGTAQEIQETVARARARRAGPDHPGTRRARAGRADILSGAGGPGAARTMHDALALARECQAGTAHAEAPGAQLRLASAAFVDACNSAAQADTLDLRLAQLQQLIASDRPREARELGDSLRKQILRPNVPESARRRGVATIKQAFLLAEDHEALLAFTRDEVAALEGVLAGQADGKGLTLRYDGCR